MYASELGIEIGKIYSYFDDGKITKSRHEWVEILEIIPFNRIENSIKAEWIQEVIDSPWLRSEKTDYFIKGKILFSNSNVEIIYFTRTVDGGWFSLGWWGGRLDLDGRILKQLTDEYGPVHSW
jgi:hypothetical protein